MQKLFQAELCHHSFVILLPTLKVLQLHKKKKKYWGKKKILRIKFLMLKLSILPSRWVHLKRPFAYCSPTLHTENTYKNWAAFWSDVFPKKIFWKDFRQLSILHPLSTPTIYEIFLITAAHKLSVFNKTEGI